MLGLFASEMSDEYPRMRAELRSVFDSWCVAVEQVLREAQAVGDIDPRHDPVSSRIPDQRLGTTVRLKINRDRGPWMISSTPPLRCC